MSTWTADGLSVQADPYPMAAPDVRVFGFDAKEAITGATATLTRWPLNTPAGTVTTGALPLAGTVASATVSGLTYGGTYRLTVTFTKASGERWSHTLLIECVA